MLKIVFSYDEFPKFKHLLEIKDCFGDLDVLHSINAQRGVSIHRVAASNNELRVIIAVARNIPKVPFEKDREQVWASEADFIFWNVIMNLSWWLLSDCPPPEYEEAYKSREYCL